MDDLHISCLWPEGVTILDIIISQRGSGRKKEGKPNIQKIKWLLHITCGKKLFVWKIFYLLSHSKRIYQCQAELSLFLYYVILKLLTWDYCDAFLNFRTNKENLLTSWRWLYFGKYETSRHLDELNDFFWKGRMFSNDFSVASSQQPGLEFGK